MLLVSSCNCLICLYLLEFRFFSEVIGPGGPSLPQDPFSSIDSAALPEVLKLGNVIGGVAYGIDNQGRLCLCAKACHIRGQLFHPKRTSAKKIIGRGSAATCQWLPSCSSQATFCCRGCRGSATCEGPMRGLSSPWGCRECLIQRWQMNFSELSFPLFNMIQRCSLTQNIRCTMLIERFAIDPHKAFLLGLWSRATHNC